MGKAAHGQGDDESGGGVGPMVQDSVEPIDCDGFGFSESGGGGKGAGEVSAVAFVEGGLVREWRKFCGDVEKCFVLHGLPHLCLK